jgi:surface antigen
MLKKIISILLLSSFIISCAEQNGPLTKQGAGTVIGGIGGAILGSNIGKGQGNVAAIALGTLAGAALGNSIGASLDAIDQQYQVKNVQETLEYGRSGRTSGWRNPDSGNYGTITPMKTYQISTGQYCREFTQTVTIGGRTQEAFGKACRQPDGAWRIVE